MRTLVVSDLHLGSRTERDVLRGEHSLKALLAELAGCDRLVLLGDIVELRQVPVRDALAKAVPVLRRIGEALGPGCEVLIVPGNHDHALAADWLARRGRSASPAPLRLESKLDWMQGDPLSDLALALAPARVRAAYPGAWLRDDVFATHGHYLDRHTTVPAFERIAAGVMARIVGEDGGEPATPETYEAVLEPIYAWIHALAQSGSLAVGQSSHGPSTRAWRALSGSRRPRRGIGRRLRRAGLAAGFPVALAGLNRAGIGPLRADLSGRELQRAGLRALGQVLQRLQVRAPHVIFGHTHRAGPLPGEEASEWCALTGAALVNSGCWIDEPAFTGRVPHRSPYRAGFCVSLGPEGAPQLHNVLDPVSSPGPA